MYTIGQVADMFGLPVSTLRYYDKQGLFPELERTSGIRRFGDTELEALRVIECLKKAGVEIKDIRLDMLKFKCWYYEQAIQDGNEDRVKALIPDDLPEEIKDTYDNAHAQ